MHTRLLSSLVGAALYAGVLLLPSTAQAQAIGARVGVSGDPQQFYFGGHAEVGPIAANQLWFRPNVEIGVGNNLTVTTANFEFAYRLSALPEPWHLYAGGGPGFVVTRAGGANKTGPGLNVVAGVEHRDGFFTEFKVGFLDSPTVKFGVGYSWKR